MKTAERGLLILLVANSRELYRMTMNSPSQTMSSDNIYVEDKLARMFDLPRPGRYTQDWEHEVGVEPNELNGLIDKFEQSELPPIERAIIMEVIVGSLNDILFPSMHPEWQSYWKRISTLIHGDFETYRELVHYWKRSSSDPQNRFDISPLFQAEFPDDPT